MEYQDTEKSKVLQSIASVIQAIPPEEAILPVEVWHPCCVWAKANTYRTQAIVTPVVAKLAEAITSAGQVGDRQTTPDSWLMFCAYLVAGRRSELVHTTTACSYWLRTWTH